jgi:succinate dehydrogenase / fumarate reductase iron-sulfur subunit
MGEYMNEKTVKITVSRFNPATDKEAHLQSYLVPITEGMSVLGALDYIYETLDSSLSYYDHAACAQGICKTCMSKINGHPALLCQTQLTEDIIVEPLDRFIVVRDIVTKRRGR